MTVIHILVLSLLAIPFMRFVPETWRSWGILLGSIAASIWFMADDILTQADTLLVIMTVLLIIATWYIIRTGTGSVVTSEDRLAMISLVIACVILPLLSDSSIAVYLQFIVGGFGGIIVASMGVVYLANTMDEPDFRRTALLLILFIILLLIGLKTPTIARFWGVQLQWDTVSLRDASPLIWLGFSYIAFRLLALLFDFRAGRLSTGGYSLLDTATYVLFFPTYTAGPIDRAQHFVPELNAVKVLDSTRLIEGGGRILVGLFKKFVVADSLALVSMSSALVDDTMSVGGLWVLVYLYALQIYFDFSGYSDVAIGLGRLYGIDLPENFNRPYLQPNVQQFWQRWHITLSTWFRIYFFTPFSRMLIRSRFHFPQWSIILLSQLATMSLIGLWHGVTMNFFIWGLWHGTGLFMHKMLADNTRKWHKHVISRTWSRRLLFVGSVFVTFHFVAIGWVFFALSETEASFSMLFRLFGVV